MKLRVKNILILLQDYLEVVPAYLFLLLEIWTDLAKKHGFKHGEDMVVQTMLGSLLLLLKTQETPKSLRAGVTSKGGTTEAALLEYLIKIISYRNYFRLQLYKQLRKQVFLVKVNLVF